jgi:hypothetical protein
LVYDLPQDYDEVFVQILIPPGRSIGGASQVTGINNYVTNDTQKWFTYGTATLEGGTIGTNTEFIFKTDVGGTLIPQVKIDWRVFPNNESVQNGNFVMTLACTRKGLNVGDALDKKKNDAREILGQQQDAYRYIKTFSGRLNCIFFGAIPMPGMCIDYTLEGVRVYGVIEQVQFTYPGFITIDVARYARLVFIGDVADYGTQFGGPL